MVRRSELDVLRGLLLLLMALTHLPTRMSAYANQPLGFVSAAEGFVFLSAFLTGSAHAAAVLAKGTAAIRSRFMSRAFKLYAYHLLLLLFAFTIAAAFAALTGRPALRNLLTFYFDSPVVAIISAPLLLYQPPLFDILPMYIVFLALTPPLLAVAAREGWRNVLLLSALLWLFAQLGGRQLVHDALGATFGARIPLEATGSFDQFAWQLLWVLGLWLGSSFADRSIRAAIPAWMLPAAFAVAAGFLLWRHGLAGFAFDLQPVAFALDKWSLGVLRLLNFAALAVVVAQLLLPLLRWAHVGVLALLGRASLQVFCVHLVLCVASLGLIVDDDTPLTAAQEALVVLVTFAVMVLVARRTAAAAKRRRTGKPPAPTPRRA
jgi:hypothetical protein